jgi:tRNA U38,U39,U40 pseudouridine synthase TruA
MIRVTIENDAGTQVRVQDDDLAASLYKAMRHYEYSGISGSLNEHVAKLVGHLSNHYDCPFEARSEYRQREECRSELERMQAAAEAFIEAVEKYRERR